jgi:hypothetical protein
MTRRGLDVTGRILRDLISGHLMHLHLIHIDCNNQSTIAIIAVHPNVILGRQYFFSRQIKSSFFLSGKI